MFVSVLRLLLLLLLFQNAYALAASSDARDAVKSPESKALLQRMLESAQTLSYQGVFVYVQGQTLEVMSVVHSVDGSKRRQRLTALNGEAREVAVSGENVVCSLPQQQIAFSTAQFHHSPLPINLPQDLDALERTYQFDMVGDDRVAGREARIVAIKPRDMLRFGYRLWLDNVTGMVLRSALLDDAGRVREQFVFTEFKVHDKIAPALLMPTFAYAKKAGAFTSNILFSERVNKPTWQASQLPAGFQSMLQQRRPNQPVKSDAHIVFSDGLATVSVFIEKLTPNEPALEGSTHIDAMSAYGVIYQQQHQIVAVGDVPMETVKQIALAIEPIE